MKERPIIFNTEMVKAILDGRKTVTRRPVEPQPFKYENGKTVKFDRKKGMGCIVSHDGSVPLGWIREMCPFAQIGDRLYVRETALYWYGLVNGKPEISHVAAFKADGYELEGKESWTPSIHMPKKYARIWLEITDIRVERVQDITEEQAEKEGTRPLSPSWTDQPRTWFMRTWNSIYKNWNDNPWVWVIEFKKVINE